MEITCPWCVDTPGEMGGETCTKCGGDTVFEVTGATVKNLPLGAGLTVNFQLLEDLTTKVDALQADMDIIKPQIQALYDDLNP